MSFGRLVMDLRDACALKITNYLITLCGPLPFSYLQNGVALEGSDDEVIAALLTDDDYALAPQVLASQSLVNIWIGLLPFSAYFII